MHPKVKEFIFDIIILGVLILFYSWVAEYTVATSGIGWAIGSATALIIFMIGRAEERIIKAIKEKGKE